VSPFVDLESLDKNVSWWKRFWCGLLGHKPTFVVAGQVRCARCCKRLR
jgi:hypothetical protein